MRAGNGIVACASFVAVRGKKPRLLIFSALMRASNGIVAGASFAAVRGKKPRLLIFRRGSG